MSLTITAERKHERTSLRRRTLWKCLAGLTAGAWLASANAQPTYTPTIIDDPTPRSPGDFGAVVAGAGDVNGDGIPDFLLGNPSHPAQVFVFSGSDQSLLLTLNDPTRGGRSFGVSVAVAGDVDGDDIPDLLVGAPGHDVDGNARQGQAFVFSGADGSLLLTLDDPIPQAEARFGAVAGAGDVNGDDIPDLLVGASAQDVGGTVDQGQVFVLSGADGSLLLTLDNPTPQESALFGYGVAGAGDVNGDGVRDLLVQAPFQHVGGNADQGQAFVFSGADGSLLLTLDDPTPQEFAHFGGAVVEVGDVNGDGVPDFLAGASRQDVGGSRDQGQAFVFSGADGSLLLTLDNPAPQASASFGSAVAGADVNGDGIPDLLVGASDQTVGDDLGQGQVFVFSGADGSLLLTLDNPTPQEGAFFGQAVAAVGDVNVDGVPDFLVGAPGQDVAGNVDQGQVVLFRSTSSTQFLHCPGDVDGDGVAELVLGSGADVQVKDVDGNDINRFQLTGIPRTVDTELMPDTNSNGAPELVALGRSPATAEVRDLLTGGDLGTVAFDADLAPFDLELTADRTGNGIQELAALAEDPMRVGVRDGMTGTAVNDVLFTRFSLGKDLLIYPDQNGNGAPELAVLADKRRQDGADKIEIRDVSTGAIVRQIWLGSDWRVLEQELIADQNGNGTAEVAVLRVHPDGSVNVQIRDTVTREWVSFVGFAVKYPPKELVAIPDINGNGADELVVFGRRVDGSNQKAVIKDSRTGDKLGELWFDRNFPGQDFVDCGDLNGNGAHDLALLGRRASDGALKAIIKDGKTGERLGLVWF